MSNRFNVTQPKNRQPAANPDFYSTPNADFFDTPSPFGAPEETPFYAEPDAAEAQADEYYDASAYQAADEYDAPWSEQESWEGVPDTPIYDGYEPAPRKRSLWWLWLIAGVVVLVVAVALGGGLGYFSGINARVKAEAQQIQGSLKEQYDLALQDVAEGRHQVAQQRLEYILKNYPTYPGAAEKLAEVKMALSMTMSVPGATQVVLPAASPTITATPDLHNAEQTLQSAKNALASKDWGGAIDLLLKMRKNYPDYESVRVDGLLYVAYRNRGITKIANSDLESGTYDFALAERYGPLDMEAGNYRTWANLYTIGASFWELDWGQAAQYFGQVAQLAPQLRDSSGLPANQRYQTALVKYADQLMSGDEYCRAEEQYNIAVQSGRADIQPTAQAAHDLCSPPTEAAPAETPVPVQ